MNNKIMHAQLFAATSYFGTVQRLLGCNSTTKTTCSSQYVSVMICMFKLRLVV